jgi:hypothetical protein
MMGHPYTPTGGSGPAPTPSWLANQGAAAAAAAASPPRTTLTPSQRRAEDRLQSAVDWDQIFNQRLW